ncbi:hypothetical protein B9Z55_014132 [Caenorhabditis nigoni]|uniref:Uncharacterized protein n=1 Tax=Caenorhabditis nigoni TaxID=1611254 RepID=A0A2G5U4Q6_9PELO|nr:hypothetical protein B9Z55_014132 [Caenorhabditis nigoni]
MSTTKAKQGRTSFTVSLRQVRGTLAQQVELKTPPGRSLVLKKIDIEINGTFNLKITITRRSKIHDVMMVEERKSRSLKTMKSMLQQATKPRETETMQFDGHNE